MSWHYCICSTGSRQYQGPFEGEKAFESLPCRKRDADSATRKILRRRTGAKFSVKRSLGSLSTLPPEIRIKIFTFVIEALPAWVFDHYQPRLLKDVPRRKNKTHTGILSVSQQFYLEALPVFYGSRTFIIDAPRIGRFLGKIGSDARAAVKRLTVKRRKSTLNVRDGPFVGGTSPQYIDFGWNRLKDCGGLQELVIYPALVSGWKADSGRSNREMAAIMALGALNTPDPKSYLHSKQYDVWILQRRTSSSDWKFDKRGYLRQ